MSLTILISPLTWLTDKVRQYRIERLDKFPLKAKLFARNGSPPVIVLTLVNQSSSVPVYVKEVRAHFGHPDYTYYFIFLPKEKTKIEPKDSHEFLMPGNHIGKRTRSKGPIPGSDYPSFEHPGDLFRAIMNGKLEASWMEVDYNEVDGYVLRGIRLKDMFTEVARMAQKNTPSSATPPAS